MNANPESTPHLAVRPNLTLVYAISLVVASLVTITSVAGLVYQTDIYPTDALLEAFVPSDVVSLFLGLPILLGSMWLARRVYSLRPLCARRSVQF